MESIFQGEKNWLFFAMSVSRSSASLQKLLPNHTLNGENILGCCVIKKNHIHEKFKKVHLKVPQIPHGG